MGCGYDMGWKERMLYGEGLFRENVRSGEGGKKGGKGTGVGILRYFYRFDCGGGFS